MYTLQNLVVISVNNCKSLLGYLLIHSLSFIGMIETRRPSQPQAGEIMQQWTIHAEQMCQMTDNSPPIYAIHCIYVCFKFYVCS